MQTKSILTQRNENQDSSNLFLFTEKKLQDNLAKKLTECDYISVPVHLKFVEINLLKLKSNKTGLANASNQGFFSFKTGNLFF